MSTAQILNAFVTVSVVGIMAGCTIIQAMQPWKSDMPEIECIRARGEWQFGSCRFPREVAP